MKRLSREQWAIMTTTTYWTGEVDFTRIRMTCATNPVELFSTILPMELWFATVIFTGFVAWMIERPETDCTKDQVRDSSAPLFSQSDWLPISGLVICLRYKFHLATLKLLETRCRKLSWWLWCLFNLEIVRKAHLILNQYISIRREGRNKVFNFFKLIHNLMPMRLLAVRVLLQILYQSAIAILFTETIFIW